MVFFAEHLCTTAQKIADFSSGEDERFICMVEEYIGANLGSDISLLTVAEQTGYSQGHFSKKFHKLFGMTFSAYVQKQRVEAAKILLLQADTKASDAAFAAGFNSISQFNRTFRNLEGCTPSKWRHSREK
jgi:AraC-like DNA-binding protein